MDEDIDALDNLKTELAYIHEYWNELRKIADAVLSALNEFQVGNVQRKIGMGIIHSLFAFSTE